VNKNPLGAALWALLALAALVLLFAAVTGLLLAVVVVVGLTVLNLVYLPRAAARLHVRPTWLALSLIPVAILAGALVDGIAGAAWGAGVWLLTIGLPRVIARDMGQRVRRRIESRREIYDVPTRSTTRPGGRPLPPAGGPGPDEYGP
jgi:4-hydroxybenzoate polyprenyltransferase